MAEGDSKSVKIINKGQVVKGSSGPIGGIYFLTLIGAAVYFVGRVDGFWNIILAILKAFIWPALVTYNVLDLLKL